MRKRKRNEKENRIMYLKRKKIEKWKKKEING